MVELVRVFQSFELIQNKRVYLADGSDLLLALHVEVATQEFNLSRLDFLLPVKEHHAGHLV